MTRDPKLVQAVLDEEYRADGYYLYRVADGYLVASFCEPVGPREADNERARQAALGHRALKLLDKLVAAECSFDGSADEAVALVAELREVKP